MGEEFEPFDSEIDEDGRNLTQQRMDEVGLEDEPVDVDWAEDEEQPASETR